MTGRPQAAPEPAPSVAPPLAQAAELLGPLASRDVPLGPLTTYRVGGAAALFVRVEALDSQGRVLEEAHQTKVLDVTNHYKKAFTSIPMRPGTTHVRVTLKLMPKKGAFVIRKLLISAVANAEQQGEVDVDTLLIRDCNVDNGPILKRWMPRSMGRANRINRRTSHVTVVVREA